MVNHPEISMQSNSKTLLDVLMIGLGVFGGGVLALLTLWLWLNYRGDSAHSLLSSLSASMAGLLPSSWRVLLGAETQMMGLPLSGDTKAYWYMARAGGIVGYGLLWLSVVWGLVLSTKITDGLVPAPIAYGLHEFLSLGTILFAAGHALVLLGDRYIGFNIFHLTLPFVAPYKPLWTGLGTIGLYLSAILTGSFYLRKQIGQKVWRTLHYLTFGTYLLVLTHGVMAGSDSGLGVMRLIYFSTGFSVLFLVYYRLFTLKTKEVRSAKR
jgi:predicted ferric reductase